MSEKKCQLAVRVSEPAFMKESQMIAQKLGLPLIEKASLAYDFVIIKDQGKMAMQDTAAKQDPIVVDFLSGSLAYRVKNASRKKEAIAKAMGLSKGKCPQVLDATAGFGQDGFILASLGCSVLMLERSPIMALLLEDGINRALAVLDIQLKLIMTDAIVYMQALTPEYRPDIVYLDPMFPERKKSAKVKKHMQMLSLLVGCSNPQEDSNLLTAALACAKERVVVKRPKLASCLADKAPHFTIKTKDHRFDVYLAH